MIGSYNSHGFNRDCPGPMGAKDPWCNARPVSNKPTFRPPCPTCVIVTFVVIRFAGDRSTPRESSYSAPLARRDVRSWTRRSAGHDVTAVARHPEQVASRSHLVTRAGDVLDADSLRETCRDADAVVSCIGPRSNLRPGAVMSVGTAHMVTAAEGAGMSSLRLSERHRAQRWR